MCFQLRHPQKGTPTWRHRIQIALYWPVELNEEARIQFAQEFALALSTTEAGPLPYTFAVHRGKGKNGKRENPHAHIIASERVGDGHDRTPETWFKRAVDMKKQTPELGGAKKSAAFQPREWLGEVRELWATRANDALELAGKKERIDHRSYAARGTSAFFSPRHSRWKSYPRQDCRRVEGTPLPSAVAPLPRR